MIVRAFSCAFDGSKKNDWSALTLMPYFLRPDSRVSNRPFYWPSGVSWWANPYTRFLLLVASSPAYCALPGPACLPMNSDAIVAACSGDAPAGQMYGWSELMIFCGTAVAHVPMHSTPRCASSSEKTVVDCWGPPRPANGFMSAMAMASALDAVVSAPLPVPSKNCASILRP